MKNKEPNWMHWIAGAIAGLIFMMLGAVMSNGGVL